MIYRQTESLCPICLRRLDASYELEGAIVYFKKTCPEHGLFSVPIWRELEGLPTFASWSKPKTPAYPKEPSRPFNLGCPYDCGLCPEHAQHTCTALLEVTKNCNLNCTVCYADAGQTKSPDPTLAQLAELLAKARLKTGRCNLQISGGEPTVRDDLPEIIKPDDFSKIEECKEIYKGMLNQYKM